MTEELIIHAGVYLTFSTGGKIRKIACYIDLQTYVHMDTLQNSRQNDSNRR